jgi:hypothetical protein
VKKLAELLPDAQAVLDLEPDELGLYILRVLGTWPPQYMRPELGQFLAIEVGNPQNSSPGPFPLNQMWQQFHRGKYPAAVFEAMKAVEVAVRAASGLAVATVVGLAAAVALSRGLDRHHYCETGFSPLVSCTLQWSSTSVSQGTPDPAFASRSSSTSVPLSPRHTPGYFEATSFAVAHCPENYIAKRLLCATSVAAPAQAASDDLATGLPRPKPWVLTMAKKTPFIESVHVETPLDLAAALGFYRAELSKRGWTENDGAVVEPDRAEIAFTTTDGPALLRLIHQDERTIADLLLRKPAAANAGNLPRPGKARLLLGNATDEEAVITINGETVTLAARAGRHLADDPDAGSKSSDSPAIDLPPGKFKVASKVASGAAQNREFWVAADETWGLLVGPDGVPLPVHLY